MSTKNYGIMILISCVVLLSLLLSACGGQEEAPITVPAGAQAGDLVALEPCTYEAGDGEYAADCGTLVAPENRSDPNSRLIALPVVRIRATGSNPAEPILQLRGGPGQTNMGIINASWFVENHDIVLVGYRGVDGSVVLDCPEVVKMMRGGGGDLLNDPMLDRSSSAFGRCAERLRSEGVDLDGYTVAETVDDMEAARNALKYDHINLLSGSYGTNLARIYATMYPKSIYRSAMGVDTPGGHDPRTGSGR